MKYMIYVSGPEWSRYFNPEYISFVAINQDDGTVNIFLLGDSNHVSLTGQQASDFLKAYQRWIET